MSNVVNAREQNKTFDLHLSENLEEVFVDGMGYAMLGYPISKLTFHTVQPPKNGDEIEQRQAVLRLTMTTASLIEFCQNTLLTLETNKAQLLAAKTQFDGVYMALQSKSSQFVESRQTTTPEKSVLKKTRTTRAPK